MKECKCAGPPRVCGTPPCVREPPECARLPQVYGTLPNVDYSKCAGPLPKYAGAP